MGIKEIIDYIVSNGLGVVCVAYLIYFQHTTMTKMQDILNTMNTRLAIIEEFISKLDLKKIKKDGE